MSKENTLLLSKFVSSDKPSLSRKKRRENKRKATWIAHEFEEKAWTLYYEEFAKKLIYSQYAQRMINDIDKKLVNQKTWEIDDTNLIRIANKFKKD